MSVGDPPPPVKAIRVGVGVLKNKLFLTKRKYVLLKVDGAEKAFPSFLPSQEIKSATYRSKRDSYLVKFKLTA